ncbi:ABC transporter permease [Vibrio maerlii]|uniref:ABC transporter permease n=1 Tax=Vibrio maerlii TaxID=2231648 RepID=UPI000E3D66AA|nr:FtsX-like permease family protein [Vibrio maerlii]
MSDKSIAPLPRLTAWSWKEIRHGQLWPITIALTLIIASVFALSALANRMEQVIVKQTKDALTADKVFISANPIPDSLEALPESVDSSRLTRFATMAFSDEAMQLVTVRAVDSKYPLLGEMALSKDATSVAEVEGHVKPGELWLEERVLSLLDVNIGDLVTIGDADLRVTGRVVSEPGLSFNPFQQMPSVYIHQTDIDKTGALQLGSRVQFRLFLVGDEAVLTQLEDNVELTASDRWRSRDSRSRTNEVFEKTEQYLSLTVAIVIIMAATTLVLTCQHYVQSRRKTIAMLKSLGATKRWIWKWLTIQLSLLFVSAAVAGLLIGVGLETLLRIPLADLLPNPLPSYGITPAVVALLSSFLIAVPALGIPLINLVVTPALNVLQATDVDQKTSNRSLMLLLVPIIPMLIAYGSNILVWMILGGIVVLFFVLAGLSILVAKLLAKVPLSVAMKLAVSRITRSNIASGVQFGALALSLMLLAIIWLVRTDLLTDWQRTLPADAPNAFSLNIAPYEVDAYTDFLDERNIQRSPAFPITRGRLTKINGEDAKARDTGGESTDALRREINFTWGSAIPEYNEVIEGEWTDTNGVSVEQEVATALGLSVGDELTFTVGAAEFKARVNSTRFVEWRDMKPNFYFIFTPDVLKAVSETWLVSFRIEDEHNQAINELTRAYPTVSLMDIRVMGEKIQSLVEQIVWAITILAALGVIAGLLLIFTLLRLSLSQRQTEIQLYRTLGASRKRVLSTLWCEYGLMAAIAGLVAAIAAEGSVAALMKWGFELSPSLHLSMWVTLPLLTFVVLGLVVQSLIKKLLIPVSKDMA